MTGPGLLLVILMIINTKTSKAFRQDEEYCNYIRMKGQPNWTTSNNHTTTDFHDMQETSNQDYAITDNFPDSNQPEANLLYSNNMIPTVHHTANTEPGQPDYWDSGLWNSTGECETSERPALTSAPRPSISPSLYHPTSLRPSLPPSLPTSLPPSYPPNTHPPPFYPWARTGESILGTE